MVAQSQFIEMFSGREYPQLPIRDFADITTGSTPSKSHPEFWGGSNSWVSAEDMKDKYVYDTVEKVTDKGYATCKHIPVNTLLYVCRGSIGVMAINKVECATNQSICTATCKADKCEVEFLYHSLLYKKDEIKQIGIGTNFKSLNQTTFSNLRIFLPPIEEQRRFVSITTQADKSKFDGLKSQFIEMFGDTFQNERGWTYKKLPEVSTIVLGSTPSSSNPAFWDGDVKWITPAELSDDSFYLYDSERHITEEGVKSTSLKPFPAGTVILSTRAPIGKTAIAGCEMYCNQGFKNFVCDNTINPVYLFYSLRIHNPELQKMGTGSTFLELSKKAIEQISISVPPKELQDEFEQFYKQADKSKYLS